MKTALVTGGSGFVGGHLIGRLVAEGWRVRAVGRRPVAGADEQQIFDLTRMPDWNHLMETVDTVFHLAAWQPGRGDPASARTLNVEVTQALGHAAAKAGVRRFIHLSSTAAMGNANGTTLDETCDCRPSSLYEVTKRDAELRLLAIDGLAPAILRPPMIGGAGLNGGPLLKLMQLCRRGRFPVFGGRSDMAKPLVHVSDLVDAMLLAAAHDTIEGIFLITSGQPHPLGEMLAVCADLLGRDEVAIQLPLGLAQWAAALSTPLFRAIGRESPLSNARLAMFMADRRFDIGKARQGLGYTPKMTTTHDILAPSYQHFKASGQL